VFKFQTCAADPHRMSLFLPFLSLVLLFVSSSSFGQEGDKVKSISPIEVRTSSGQVMKCSLSVDSFSKWDGRDVVQMSGVKAAGCGTGNFIFEKPITIESESGTRYTIPANRTILYLTERGAQIDVKNSERGGIAVESEGKHELSDRVYSVHEDRKKESAALIEKFRAEVAKKNYSKAREAYSKIVNANELYSEEINKIGGEFDRMPAPERPLKTYASDMRWQMDELKKTFAGVDFDKMTVKEYLAFVKDWAEHPDKFKGSGDQTYLFRIFDTVGVSKEDRYDLYYRAYASRMAKVRKAYQAKKDPEFNDTYVIGICIRSMEHVPGGAAFLQKLKENLARIDSKERDYLQLNLYELGPYLPEKPKTVDPVPEPEGSGSGK
jgi:hypothetical protein